MAKAALFHIKTKHVVQDAAPVTLHIALVKGMTMNDNIADRAGLPISHPLPGEIRTWRQAANRFPLRMCWRAARAAGCAYFSANAGVPGADCRADAASCRGAQFSSCGRTVTIPDARILEIYNALGGRFVLRSPELQAIADELEHTAPPR